MKIVKKVSLFSAGILALSVGVYSFSSREKEEEPRYKQYEVIRMVNGEMMNFDTLVPLNSTYTPRDYLATLGFENDNGIEIIDLTELHDLGSMERKVNGLDSLQKRIVVEVNQESDGESIDGLSEIKIEKHECTRVNSDDMVEIEFFMKDLNLDSLLQTIETVDINDTLETRIYRTTIITDKSSGELDSNFQWHQCNTDGANFHKVSVGDRTKSEVAIWNDGADMTIVIVTEVSKKEDKRVNETTSNKKSPTTLSIFPNPATDLAIVKIEFKDREKTAITVTDVQGRVVLELDLGEISGNFNHQLDVKNWQKGVYLVQVRHGETNTIDRLVVE